MSTVKADLRVRLWGAALALFRDRGFNRTTAAEIAARASVTERTFFRHFPDKKEVLFDGEAIVRGVLTSTIAETPAEVGALDTLFGAFRSLGPTMEDRRPCMVSQNEIIVATAALQERELSEVSSLTDALTFALKARGVPDLRAAFAAQIGMAAFTHVTLEWLDDPRTGLPERLDLVARELFSFFSRNRVSCHEMPVPGTE